MAVKLITEYTDQELIEYAKELRLRIVSTQLRDIQDENIMYLAMTIALEELLKRGINKI
jgi:hypothetical protein